MAEREAVRFHLDTALDMIATGQKDFRELVSSEPEKLTERLYNLSGRATRDRL